MSTNSPATSLPEIAATTSPAPLSVWCSWCDEHKAGPKEGPRTHGICDECLPGFLAGAEPKVRQRMGVMDEARERVARIPVRTRCAIHGRTLAIFGARLGFGPEKDEITLRCEVRGCACHEVIRSAAFSSRLRRVVPPGSSFENPDFHPVTL